MKKDLPAAQFPLVLPLVLSILAEIKDRRRRFRLLQAAARAEPRTKLGMRRQELARAESQAHQTELRRAMHELEQLGCFRCGSIRPCSRSARARGRSCSA
jgi:hypothetical protein